MQGTNIAVVFTVRLQDISGSLNFIRAYVTIMRCHTSNTNSFSQTEHHHHFLALSAASRVEGFNMPDLNNEKIFLIKDFSKSSTGQHHFEWDALVELNYRDYVK